MSTVSAGCTAASSYATSTSCTTRRADPTSSAARRSTYGIQPPAGSNTFTLKAPGLSFAARLRPTAKAWCFPRPPTSTTASRRTCAAAGSARATTPTTCSPSFRLRSAGCGRSACTCSGCGTLRPEARPQRPAHQRALAEQRLDQVHREHRGLVLLIERRVELHHVEGGEAPRIGDHLHAQLRLAVGRTARDPRTDARRDPRVEKVHVEAHVQVGIVVHSGERLLHGRAHAHLVHVAHVEHVEPLLVHEALLAVVDAADADLPHPARVDGGAASADRGQLAWPEAAQHRDRHAVDVAAR